MSAPTAGARTEASERVDVTFPSGDAHCVAWLYRPAGAAAQRATGTCIVMGHGFSLTRDDGLAAYAERFAAAGASVLVFDHRHLGDSPGEPRQRFRKREQLEDWRVGLGERDVSVSSHAVERPRARAAAALRTR